MQSSIPAATLRTQFLHIHFLIHATVDVVDYVSCVKTVMAVPVTSRFRVGSAQVRMVYI